MALAKRTDAFTVKYTGRSLVLMSEATVGPAFNPSKSSAPKQEKFKAIWDTGATNSVISPDVVQACSLKPTGQTNVKTAGGTVTCSTYLVSIFLPNNVGFPSVRVTEAPLTEGANVLIGMDIIGFGDFATSNHEGGTVFTYRCPSVVKTDYVEETNQLNRAIMKKVGRNALCPCGSGKKYKICCGRSAA
jgi:hypothetical protein